MTGTSQILIATIIRPGRTIIRDIQRAVYVCPECAHEWPRYAAEDNAVRSDDGERVFKGAHGRSRRAQHRFQTAFHVVVRRCPRGYADANLHAVLSGMVIYRSKQCGENVILRGYTDIRVG